MNLEPEYGAIRAAYGDRKALRSGRPYIEHIHHGLVLLQRMGAEEATLRAWCVHPIFQIDAMFSFLKVSSRDVLSEIVSSARVAVIAMEYRAVANAFLTKSSERHRPKVSMIDAVNDMLIVDKVQNYRSARLHLFPKIHRDESDHLTWYFQQWFSALEVSEAERTRLEAILEEVELTSGGGT